MAKPNWNPTIEEVLKRPTVKLSKISQKTGKEYVAEVIEQAIFVLAGSPEIHDDFVKYPIADINKNLEYTIKVENKVLDNLNFGQKIIFKNVTGGSLSNGSAWYKADNAELYVSKA